VILTETKFINYTCLTAGFIPDDMRMLDAVRIPALIRHATKFTTHNDYAGNRNAFAL
jgi:hypothetical protein